MSSFSKGHWDNPEAAIGDKRNVDNLERWQGLAKIGTQTERKLVSRQATTEEKFHGAGDLTPIDESWPTIQDEAARRGREDRESWRAEHDSE